MFVDCRNKIKTPLDKSIKFWILFYITNCNIHLSFLINYQRFSMQWYDQAAQPQNMTFSQRKSAAEKSSYILLISDIFLIFIIFILLCLSKLRKLFGETCNFEDILSFPWISIFIHFLLRYVVSRRCMNVEKTELFKRIMLTRLI